MASFLPSGCPALPEVDFHRQHGRAGLSPNDDPPADIPIDVDKDHLVNSNVERCDVKFRQHSEHLFHCTDDADRDGKRPDAQRRSNSIANMPGVISRRSSRTNDIHRVGLFFGGKLKSTWKFGGWFFDTAAPCVTSSAQPDLTTMMCSPIYFAISFRPEQL